MLLSGVILVLRKGDSTIVNFVGDDFRNDFSFYCECVGTDINGNSVFLVKTYEFKYGSRFSSLIRKDRVKAYTFEEAISLVCYKLGY